MVEKSIPWPYDDIVIANTGNTRRLEEIDFGGKKDSLVFVSNQTAMK